MPGENLPDFAEAYELAEADDVPPGEWKTVTSETITLRASDRIPGACVKQVREVMGMTSVTYYFSVGHWVLFVWHTPAESPPAESPWDAEFSHLLDSLHLSPKTETLIESQLGQILERERVSERPWLAPEAMAPAVQWDEDPTGWVVPFVGWHPISQRPGCWTTHQGWLYESIDYSMPVGTSVKATDIGYVLSAGWSNGGWGNRVRLRHASDGFDSWYAHLSSFGSGIYPGRPVQQYQVVGLSGDTGASTGPHLHFHAKVIGQRETHWIRTLPNTRWKSGNPYSPCSPGNDGSAWGP